MRRLAALLLVLTCAASALAEPRVASRRLHVRLDPASGGVDGTGEIAIAPDGGGVVTLELATGLAITSLTRAGAPVEPLVASDLGNGTTLWRFPVLEDPGDAAPVTLAVAWSGRYEAPRGATFADDAIDLPESARWAPTPDHPAAWHAALDVPAGLRCVLRGVPLGREETAGRATETWTDTLASAGIPLAAGPWTVREARVGDRVVAVWGSAPEDADVDAAVTAYRRIAEVLGPCPAPRFDVLPDRALAASSAPGLAALRWGALDVQAARCWWGHAVLDAPGRERWADALARYTAEHLAVGDADTVLRRRGDALSRLGPATPAADVLRRMLAFQALRTEIGDAAFRTALAAVLRDRAGRIATWDDWAHALSAAAGQDVGAAVEQWARRPGAPLLVLRDVRTTTSGGRLRVAGSIGQIVVAGEAPWRLTVPVVVELLDGRETLSVEVAGEETAFSAIVPALPVSVTLDPDLQVPRRLSREPGGEPLAGSRRVLPDVGSAADPRRVGALLERLAAADGRDTARRAVLDELRIAGLDVRERHLDVTVRERGPGATVLRSGAAVDGCFPLTCSPETDEEGVAVEAVAVDPGDDLDGRALVVDVPHETDDLASFARGLAGIARSSGAVALLLRLPEDGAARLVRSWRTPADAPPEEPSPVLFARRDQLAGGPEVALPVVAVPADFDAAPPFRVRVRWSPAEARASWVHAHVGAQEGRAGALLLVAHVGPGAAPSGASAVAEAAQLLAPHAALLGRDVEVVVLPADAGSDAALDELLPRLGARPALTLSVGAAGTPGDGALRLLASRGAEDAVGVVASALGRSGIVAEEDPQTRLLVRYAEQRGPCVAIAAARGAGTQDADADRVGRLARGLALAVVAASVAP